MDITHITKETILNHTKELKVSDIFYLSLLIDIRDMLKSLDRHLSLALEKLNRKI